MSSYETRQNWYAYKEQSTFGTAEAVTGGNTWFEVTCDPFNIDPDVQVHELPQAHGTRQPTEQNTAHSTSGSASSFSVSGPVDLNDIDQFLYAHFQKVVEGADTEYTKTFTYFSTHPDWSSTGHWLSWVKGQPGTGTSQRVKDCVCPRIKLSGERDGFIMFESDWIARGTTEDAVNFAGTRSPRTGSGLLYFNDIASATLSHGASLASPLDIKMRSFEVEGVWEYDKVGHDGTEGFDEWGIRTRSGTFKIELLRDSSIDYAIASMKEGEMVQFSVDVGTLTITVTGKIESNEYSTEGLLMSTLTCRMLSTYTSGSVGECLTVVVQNSVDRSWPAA